jgi:chromosome segregation ATPase
LGFGDKAFDGVADYLSKTVTEETQIETTIVGVEPLLKAFQGELDKARGETTTLKREKGELEAKIKDLETKPPKPEEKPDDIDAKIKALVAESVKPFQEKLSAYESKETQATFEAKVLKKAQELGIPQFRIDEGFTIASDADDNAINTHLSKVKQNMVTAGLEKKSAFGNVLATSDDVLKQEADEWAKSLPDAKGS